MAQASTLKDEHARIRSLFTGNTPVSSSSPIAFLEKTSNNLKLLADNDNDLNKKLTDQLAKNNKLLKSIKGNTSDGLSFTDLIMARLIGSTIGRSVKFAGGLLGTILSGKYITGPLSYLKTNVVKLTKNVTTSILKGTGKSIQVGWNVIKAAGRPLVSLLTSTVGFFTNGGFISVLSKTVSLLGKSGPLLKGGAGLLGKIFGKLLWPITAIISAYEGFNGYKNADKILGTPVKSKMRKLQVGVTEIINGLLFGLPDKIAKYFGADSFSKAVDNKVQAIGKFFTEDLPVYLKESVSYLIAKIRYEWQNFNFKEALSGLKTLLINKISAFGSYLENKFTNMYDFFKSRAEDLYNSLSDYKPVKHTPEERRNRRAQYQIGMLENEDKKASLLDRRELRNQLKSYYMLPSTIEKLSNSSNNDSTSTSAYNILSEVSKQKVNISDYGSEATRFLKSGIDAANTIGNASVAVTSASAQLISSKLASQSNNEDINSSFDSLVNGTWTDILKDAFAKIPEIYERETAKMFSNETKQLMQDVVTGNMQSFDMAGAAQSAGIQTYDQGSVPGMPEITTNNDGSVIESPRVRGVPRSNPVVNSDGSVVPGDALPLEGTGTNVKPVLKYGQSATSSDKLFKAKQFREAGVDPRMMDIVNEAANNLPDGYSIELFSGDRVGGKGNHKNGYAIDWNLYKDGKLVKQPYISPGKGGFWQRGGMGGATQNYREYEKVAQEMKKVQMQKYPNMPFRWGGYFGGSNPNDTMHVDNTPGGAMGQGSWETGLFNKNHPFSRGSYSEGMGNDLTAGGFSKEEREIAANKHKSVPVNRSIENTNSTPTAVSSNKFGPWMKTYPSKRPNRPYSEVPGERDYSAKSQPELLNTVTVPTEKGILKSSTVKADSTPVRKTTPNKDVKPLDLGQEVKKAMQGPSPKPTNVDTARSDVPDITNVPTYDSKSMRLINSDVLQ